MAGYKLEVVRMERSHTKTWTVTLNGEVLGIVTTRENGPDGLPIYSTTYWAGGRDAGNAVTSDERHGGEFGNVSAVQEILNKAQV